MTHQCKVCKKLKRFCNSCGKKAILDRNHENCLRCTSCHRTAMPEGRVKNVVCKDCQKGS